MTPESVLPPGFDLVYQPLVKRWALFRYARLMGDFISEEAALKYAVMVYVTNNDCSNYFDY